MDEPQATAESSKPNNWLWAVLAVLVVVLLAGGLVAYKLRGSIKARLMGRGSDERTEESQGISPTSVPTVPTATSSGEAMTTTVVTFDGSAFSPVMVTVKKGTAVKFVNSSSVTMSVASAPHPIHTDYPEFDQTKDPVQKGQSTYVFTFDKVGTWKYHNHAPFLPGGKIVVTE